MTGGDDAIQCYDCGTVVPRSESRTIVHEMGSYQLCKRCGGA